MNLGLKPDQSAIDSMGWLSASVFCSSGIQYDGGTCCCIGKSGDQCLPLWFFRKWVGPNRHPRLVTYLCTTINIFLALQYYNKLSPLFFNLQTLNYPRFSHNACWFMLSFYFLSQTRKIDTLWCLRSNRLITNLKVAWYLLVSISSLITWNLLQII